MNIQPCCVCDCCRCRDDHICNATNIDHEEPENGSFCEDCYGYECIECRCRCYCDV